MELQNWIWPYSEISEFWNPPMKTRSISAIPHSVTCTLRYHNDTEAMRSFHLNGIDTLKNRYGRRM